MNNSILISIIIPVYNVAKFLPTCLDSICKQDFINWECILIDDGSIDTSGSICDEYATRNKGFKVFHKPNSGVSSARLHGLREAKGNWLCFVDADDILPQQALSILVNQITDSTSIVFGNYILFSNQTNERKISPISITNTVTDKDLTLALLLEGKVNTAPWAKLYKSTEFKESYLNLPRDITNKEDSIMNFRFISSMSGIAAYTSQITYEYRIGRADSAFNKRYASGSLNLEYELKVHSYLLESLKSIPDVSTTLNKSISIMNYNFLWYIKSLLKTANENQHEKILAIFKTVDLKAVNLDGWLKKWIKYLLIKALL